MARAVLLVAVAAGAALCGCGTCAGVCSPAAMLTFTDASGTPVGGARGTVSAGSQVANFDCATDGVGTPAGDGGTGFGGWVRCASGRLVLNLSMPAPASATVTATTDLHGSFSGSVPLSFSPTGQQVCGSRCDRAASTVALH